MSPIRWLGASILVLGLLLILNFLATPINPSVTLADLGVLALLLGSLVLAYDALGIGRTASHGLGNLFRMSIGWQLLSAGLLVAMGGFLMENQVSCACPAYGPCDCGAMLYDLAIAGGALAALLGVVITVTGRK